MIDSFDKFIGKVKSLDREEVIELVSLISEMNPHIQKEVDNSNISKLLDNITQYNSEDGKWSISVYFRESDIYKNEDGSITHGDFKTLFKVTITKLEGSAKIGELEEFVTSFHSIISSLYPNAIIGIKVGDDKIDLEEFASSDSTKKIENIKLIIRIL